MEHADVALVRFEAPYRVRFDEAGADGFVRPSAVLRYVQDVAWQHSEGAGFGREWYGERHLTWLVRSTQLEMLGTADYGTELAVSTEVVGFRRVWARRLSEVTRPDGERVATVLIDWVLLGASGAPTRVPPEIERAFATHIPTFTPFRVELPEAGPAPFVDELTVRRRDVDPLAHVNNAVYLDYMEETLELAGSGTTLTAVPRRYLLEYLLPAAAGAPLQGVAERVGSRWTYRLLSDDGRQLMRGVLEPVER